MGVGDMISLSISQTNFVNATLCLFRVVFSYYAEPVP